MKEVETKKMYWLAAGISAIAFSAAAIGTYQLINSTGPSVADKVFKNVLKADEMINSKLFRPPYGRITRSQVKSLKNRYKIIMWDVLSGDFDINIKPESCINNVISAAKSGSIIVFHDSEKSKNTLMKTLPEILRYYTVKGYIKSEPQGRRHTTVPPALSRHQ